MAPRLVFVHGIGGPRDPAAELDGWTIALAAGMRAAGHSALARSLEAAPGEHAAFASYADLFGRPQAQGADDTPAEAELLAALVTELVDEANELAMGDGADPEELRILAHARAEAAPTGQQQGVPDLARRVLNVVTTLLSLRPWDGAGEWITPKLMVRHLGQVSRYLARTEPDAAGVTLDARIRARVAEAVGDGPAVVVAHSLGTVVALECLHELRADVRLFVTLGSPIAMRGVVLPRLRPQPPAVPDGTLRWLNFWDRDDVIAVRPHLERDLAPGASGVRPVSARIDSDGLWVHNATKYLAQAAVAGPVAEALIGTAGLG
ncbi:MULTISPECIES: hypothetical protein [Streptomyces]|uniref:Alpha/beta hydrolase n=1 Tax=Streptomyces solicathayae TaxID=3081768 RepID=A0ABZ0LNU0_9ACTN|nr:hypothetical protein [Streptomyces sp. HUAS YS2]WOX21169.1 hypothetical protein R2D22_07125 [Streptomyces sp. HUAS YS2]